MSYDDVSPSDLDNATAADTGGRAGSGRLPLALLLTNEAIVPQQALFLMNSPLVIEQVRNVVNRDVFQNASSDDARIQFLYELFFQRPANAEEIRNGQEFVSSYQASSAVPAPAPAAGQRGGARGGQGQGQGRGRGAAAPPRVPLSAWQEYAHALLLTNEATFVN